MQTPGQDEELVPQLMTAEDRSSSYTYGRQLNGFVCVYCRAAPCGLTRDHSSGVVRALADQPESCNRTERLL